MSAPSTSIAGAGPARLESSMLPIAIFAATRWELQAVKRALPTDRIATIAGVRCHVGQKGDQVYWLIQTGIGPASAGTVAQRVLTTQAMSLVMSTGFACALVPAQVGDLILGTEVFSFDIEETGTVKGDSLLCDEAVRSGCLMAAQEAGMAARVGTVVSVPRVLWQAEGKRRLRRLTEAIGLDMESAAIALVARAQGVPMALVRTVSDLENEDLPLDFNLFLGPTRWIQGIWSLVSRPSRFAGLNRLRRQSRIAADRLTEWFEHYAEAGGGFCRELR